MKEDEGGRRGGREARLARGASGAWGSWRNPVREERGRPTFPLPGNSRRSWCGRGGGRRRRRRRRCIPPDPFSTSRVTAFERGAPISADWRIAIFNPRGSSPSGGGALPRPRRPRPGGDDSTPATGHGTAWDSLSLSRAADENERPWTPRPQVCRGEVEPRLAEGREIAARD
jgi:hypothetical protein